MNPDVARSARLYARTHHATQNALTHNQSASQFARNLSATGNATNQATVLLHIVLLSATNHPIAKNNLQHQSAANAVVPKWSQLSRQLANAADVVRQRQLSQRWCSNHKLKL